MNHSRIRARLNDFLERDLSPSERSRIQAHLDGCGDCARELRELEQMVGLLRAMPEPELPPAFTETVMSRVRGGEAEPAGLIHWLRRLLEPGLALPLAAGLTSLVFFAGLEGGSFQSPFAPPDAPPPSLALGDAESVTTPLTPPPISVAAHQPTTESRSPSRRVQLARWEANRRHRVMAVALRGAGHPHSVRMASLLEQPLKPEPPRLVLTTVALQR